MKKILFLAPKMNGPKGDFLYNETWSSELNTKINRARWKIVTPALLLLASVAAEEGFAVQIADEDFTEPSSEIFYDIVSIYTVTPNFKRACRYAKRFRANGAWVVMGGVHATLLPEECKIHCNTVLIGEGEEIFRRFLQDYKSNAARTVYTQKKSVIDMTRSVVPQYQILRREEQRLVPLQTARGCSHSCQFCNIKSLYGNSFRCKTEAQIVRELFEIEKLPYAKNIYVTDDNIYSDIRHFYALTEALGCFHFTWYANTDISFGDDEGYIKRAYKSGLRQVLIGLEGISENGLRGIDAENFKYRYLKRYKENLCRIQSNGIGVVGSFIVGRENDAEDVFPRLAECIYDTSLYGASITVFTPYPGTALFHKMKNRDRIMTYDWDYYTIFQPIIKMNYMTMDRLNELYRKLIFTVYSDAFVHRRVQFFSSVYKRMGP